MYHDLSAFIACITVDPSDTYENIAAFPIMPDVKLRAKTGCVSLVSLGSMKPCAS